MSHAKRNQLTATSEAAPSLAVWQFFEWDGFHTDPLCEVIPRAPLASQPVLGGRRSFRVRIAQPASGGLALQPIGMRDH